MQIRVPNISGEGDWVFGGYASTGKFTGSMYHVSLPNITGTFTEHGNTSGLKCTGAFTGEARIGLNSNQGGAWDGGRVTMNSSLSSSVYGAASTVQPASTRLLYCIKS